jgi:hypothetical protein
MSEDRLITPPPRIEAVGDRCLLVGVGNTVDPQTSQRVFALVRRLKEQPIAGVYDIVPAFTTVALHYRPELLGEAPFEALRAAVLERMVAPLETQETAARSIDIPVCYGGEFGPDLDDVANRCGLSSEQVIASPHLHAGLRPRIPVHRGSGSGAQHAAPQLAPHPHPARLRGHCPRSELHLSAGNPRRLEPDRAHAAAVF